MLRLIIVNHKDWSLDDEIVQVREWDTDVLTRRIWKRLINAVQDSLYADELVQWDLVRVEGSADPWHYYDPDLGKQIYGERLAFGQMSTLFPDRCWISAWRWNGNFCENVLRKEFVNQC